MKKESTGAPYQPHPKNMARKVVYLPDTLVDRLEKYKEATGMALTQLVRQTLDDHLRARGY